MASNIYTALRTARELMQSYGTLLTDELDDYKHEKTILIAENGGSISTNVLLSKGGAKNWYTLGYDPEDDALPLETLAQMGANFIASQPIVDKNPGRLFEDVVVTDIYDADTMDVDVTVDIGFGSYVTHQRVVRVARIDAWEIRGKEREDGLRAKSLVKSLIPLDSRVKLRVYKKGKYGRWISDVILADGRNLADVLVESGNAEYVDY